MATLLSFKSAILCFEVVHMVQTTIELSFMPMAFVSGELQSIKFTPVTWTTSSFHTSIFQSDNSPLFVRKYFLFASGLYADSCKSLGSIPFGFRTIPRMLLIDDSCYSTTTRSMQMKLGWNTGIAI